MEQYVNITWYQLLLFMTACAFVVAGFSLFYVWYDGRIAKKERDDRGGKPVGCGLREWPRQLGVNPFEFSAG
mgnify:CR=1 FL=1